MVGCAAWRAGGGGRPPILVNPYAGVEWGAWGQYRANLHTHSTRSDGKLDPAAVTALYRDMGYRILAFTDHETVTYPWSDVGVEPGPTGLVAVEGAELYTEAHLNVLFAGLTRTRTAQNTLVEAGARGGLVILNHPASHTTRDAAWFVNLYRTYDAFIGVEAFNGGEQLRDGVPWWDLLLDELMPDRPVWGFANDDLHAAGDAGRNWTVFLLPALTPEEVRRATEAGRFYACSAQAGRDVPAIQSIVEDPDQGTVTLRADKAQTIRWISGGVEVARGAVLDYRRLPAAIRYVRAEAIGPSGGRACTNPFGLKRGGAVVARPAAAVLRAKWETVRRQMLEQWRASQLANWRRPYPLAEGIAAGDWRIVDLSAQVNRALTGPDAWIAKQHELTQLPPGLHRIHGVPFRVLHPSARAPHAVMALRSRSLPASGGRPLPEEVTVPVAGHVRALYVLHGAGFVSRHGKAGEYGFVYEDGTRAGMDIVGLGKPPEAGRARRSLIRSAGIQDWWPDCVQFENAVARQVPVGAGDRLGDERYLYSLELKNPHPGKRVKAIYFRSCPERDATLLILSATVAMAG